MFIKKLVGKKINQFLGNTEVSELYLNLQQKIFEKTYNFSVIICFCFPWLQSKFTTRK